MENTTKLSYFKGTDTPGLIDETIGERLAKTVRAFPDRDALIVRHQGIRWTYAEYAAEIEKLATGLLALGTGKGDRVGIWAPNCYEWCVTQFATARIGAILVNVNPAYRVFELEYALNKSGCKTIITADAFKSSRYVEMLQELAPELEQCEPGELESETLPMLKTVIRMGEAKTPGMFNFDEVCAMGGAAETARLAEVEAGLSPHDVINIQFTSGTTGNPKGAALSHYNILNNALQTARGMKFSEKDRLIIPVPMLSLIHI